MKETVDCFAESLWGVVRLGCGIFEPLEGIYQLEGQYFYWYFFEYVHSASSTWKQIETIVVSHSCALFQGCAHFSGRVRSSSSSLTKRQKENSNRDVHLTSVCNISVSCRKPISMQRIENSLLCKARATTQFTIFTTSVKASLDFGSSFISEWAWWWMMQCVNFAWSATSGTFALKLTQYSECCGAIIPLMLRKKL